jgi:hypothetical protein
VPPDPAGMAPRPGLKAAKSVWGAWKFAPPAISMPFAIPLLVGAVIRLIDLGSILSRLAGSKDCFLLLALEPFDLDTRNDGRDGDVGVSAGEYPLLRSSGSPTASAPHPHFCFFGIATRTPPQAHGRPGGQGQVLRGRPGFRTGTITRS